jgi:hypothetical protein
MATADEAALRARGGVVRARRWHGRGGLTDEVLSAILATLSGTPTRKRVTMTVVDGKRVLFPLLTHDGEETVVAHTHVDGRGGDEDPDAARQAQHRSPSGAPRSAMYRGSWPSRTADQRASNEHLDDAGPLGSELPAVSCDGSSERSQ